jgi:patatin-like phospholipase/acyl hydrolase
MRRILSLDGGGMKGFVPTSLLVELERRIGKPCNQYFDLIAGTSIGGIVALLLAIGMPAAKALEFFTVDGPDIFQKHWWRRHGLFMPRYPAKRLEERLKKRFGAGDGGAAATLDDCRTRVLVTAFNLVERNACFFKNYDNSGRYLLWEVARATSAAQTFFPAFKLDDMILWDGGNEANNPSMCAYADAVKLWGGRERVKVLSLGCGNSPIHYQSRKLVHCGMIRNGAASLEVLYDAGSDVTDYQMQQMIGPDYFRIQPRFAELTDLDDASPAGLAALKRNAAECRVRFMPVVDGFLRENSENRNSPADPALRDRRDRKQR